MVDFTLGNGFVSDVFDKRDWIFDSKLFNKKYSGDVDLPKIAGDRLTPVSAQLWSSSCVANAGCDDLEMVNALQGGEKIELSRLHLYFNGRSIQYSSDLLTGKLSEFTLPDSGMQIRCAVRSLSLLGVCPESMWPFDLKNLNKRPPLKANLIGLKNKINSYYYVNSSGYQKLEDVHSIIKSGLPFIMAIPVSNEFRASRSDKVIQPPKSKSDTKGSHAIIGCGTIGNNIKIRNSWGTSYGLDGYSVLHEGWFTNNFVESVWVFTKMKGLVK